MALIPVRNEAYCLTSNHTKQSLWPQPSLGAQNEGLPLPRERFSPLCGSRRRPELDVSHCACNGSGSRLSDPFGGGPDSRFLASDARATAGILTAHCEAPGGRLTVSIHPNYLHSTVGFSASLAIPHRPIQGAKRQPRIEVNSPAGGLRPTEHIPTFPPSRPIARMPVKATRRPD